jgi:gibberellin-44 dioxygenase
MELGRRVFLPVVDPSDETDGCNVVNVWRQPTIPDPFVWPRADALPSSETELDTAVVDIGATMRGGAAGLRRAAEQVASACKSHGFFQVTGHGLDPALTRAALDGAGGFFHLPLATKQRARRAPGDVSGYAAAHADRFTTKLPWKETLSFGYCDQPTDVVVDYFTSTLGNDFKPLG